jgi:hypothetical protein
VHEGIEEAIPADVSIEGGKDSEDGRDEASLRVKSRSLGGRDKSTVQQHSMEEL